MIRHSGTEALTQSSVLASAMRSDEERWRKIATRSKGDQNEKWLVADAVVRE
jgi:hypothetical protein